ncbi:hypothetical protein KN815_16080 [Streptomyces sp. 4503]|uniref:Uncharacterized protein n=1 Tax=Streptomyces niphimycinicus TaxID=2842201 RepID=A0ABS6CFB1_9ACTN|nr:hypothetical protein [Streptomyces niphimycinicus]MBU3865540.1 hypothetical protein [Streptomyces niphimycinicus]
MPYLPRRRRALVTKVSNTTSPEPAPVSPAPALACCGGFKAVKVRAGSQLITVHCWECITSPATAGVIDDIWDEDERKGYEPEPEPEDVLVGGVASTERISVGVAA